MVVLSHHLHVTSYRGTLAPKPISDTASYRRVKILRESVHYGSSSIAVSAKNTSTTREIFPEDTIHSYEPNTDFAESHINFAEPHFESNQRHSGTIIKDPLPDWLSNLDLFKTGRWSAEDSGMIIRIDIDTTGQESFSILREFTDPSNRKLGRKITQEYKSKFAIDIADGKSYFAYTVGLDGVRLRVRRSIVIIITPEQTEIGGARKSNFINIKEGL